MKDLLRQLPPETGRQYEFDLADLALNADRARLQEDLDRKVQDEDENLACAMPT